MAFSQIQGKMQIMRILIANDDGIYAAGIKAIAAEFSKKHQVMVVAPDHERSGASHSIKTAGSDSDENSPKNRSCPA